MIFGDFAWAELLSVANIVFGLILFWFSVDHTRKLKGFPRWLRFVIALIGLYWAGFYLFVLLTPAGTYDPVRIPQLFVRPMLSLTIGIMAAHALYRARITK